jgi:hypothetical protein
VRGEPEVDDDPLWLHAIYERRRGIQSDVGILIDAIEAQFHALARDGTLRINGCKNRYGEMLAAPADTSNVVSLPTAVGDNEGSHWCFPALSFRICVDLHRHGFARPNF